MAEDIFPQEDGDCCKKMTFGLFQLKKANLNNMTGSLLHKMNDIVANITMNDDQHYDNSLISVLDQNALSSGSYSWKYS